MKLLHFIYYYFFSSIKNRLYNQIKVSRYHELNKNIVDQLLSQQTVSFGTNGMENASLFYYFIENRGITIRREQDDQQSFYSFLPFMYLFLSTKHDQSHLLVEERKYSNHFFILFLYRKQMFSNQIKMNKITQNKMKTRAHSLQHYHGTR